MDDFAALNGKLSSIAARFEGTGLREMTTRVGVKAKKTFIEKVKRDAGDDMRLRNWRRGAGDGVKLGVGFDLVSDHEIKFRPRPSGPFKTLDQGALSHTIESKASKITGRGSTRARQQQRLNRAFGGTGAFSGSKPMPVGGAGFAFRAKHPGSKGKNTWSDGRSEVNRNAARWVHEEVRAELARIFGPG